jgi:hypothetical protein
MALPYTQHFNACLPGIALPVRITSLYDAQVFVRRWVIRDKDPALRALRRLLERADSSKKAYEALLAFKTALMARDLFPGG